MKFEGLAAEDAALRGLGYVLGVRLLLVLAIGALYEKNHLLRGRGGPLFVSCVHRA
jgi:hypothetical protein